MNTASPHPPHFGDLWALLAQGPQISLGRLLPLIEHARAHAPERFEQEWLTYMEGFNMPRASARTLKQLEHIGAHMPHNTPIRSALFSGPGKHTSALMKSPLFKRVSDVHVTYFEASTLRDVFWDAIDLNTLRNLELTLGHKARTWLDDLKHYSAALTSLERLWFSDATFHDTHARILSEARFPALTYLSMLYAQMDDGALEVLTHAPWFAQLKTLDVRINALSARGVERLSTPGVMPNIQDLALQGNALDEQALASLARAPWAKHLRRLDLQDTSFASEHLQHITQPERFSQLRELRLSSNSITPRNIRDLDALPSLCTVSVADIDLTQQHLNAMGSLSRVTSWSLDGNDLKDLDLSPFLRTQGVAFDTLDMEHCALSPHHIEVFQHATGLGTLAHLFLGANDLDDRAAHILAASGLTSLRTLELQSASLGAQGLHALAHSTIGRTLLQLDCSGCELSADAALALGRFEGLESLYATGDGMARVLGDEGVVCLARSAKWTRIRGLDLSSNGITDEGARALAQAPWMRTVHYLALHNNAITSSGYKALRDSPYTSPYLEI